VRPGAGRRAAALLRARGAAVEIAVHELLVDLAAAAPITIVLDDLHVIEDAECITLLGHAIERLPPGVRIVAGTRADPPLPLGRLRARGLLGELRARDLAFTVEEAREILVDAEGLELDDEEIQALVERAEGWPVAVYLIALWLRDQDDPRVRVGELAAHRSYVGEFLTDEILSSLDPRIRSFLVRTSVLTYLSAPLCDAVLGRDDSEEVLLEVSSSNLLIARLDLHSEWFRIHGLFRELLQLELDRVEPGAAVELHRRAAAWLREHDFLEGAVAHALDAGEHDVAAAVISDVWMELLGRGEGETLLRLVEHLPRDIVIANPELAASSALATYLARRHVHERLR
jgi:LuxR family transcriptional regulator, maltose regulon positive regulatory protein